jgi:hypothetical protein
MSESQLGKYSEFDEPLVQLELVGRSDVASETKLFLVDSGFNKSMLTSLSVVIALGWPITDSYEDITYGGGAHQSAMKTSGFVRFSGNLRAIDVLALPNGVAKNKTEIEGYIGMVFLKGTRLDFGQKAFSISTYEG